MFKEFDIAKKVRIDGKTYSNNDIEVESVKTYDICYQIAGKVYEIGHTATIYKVDAYASEVGDLAGKSKSELMAGDYALENISVTKDHGDVINVQDYYRFFIGDSEIEVNFKNQSNRYTSIEVTGSKSYTICCTINSFYIINCIFFYCIF